MNILEHSDFILVTDIGSGISFKRKGLQTILDKCLQRTIGTVVIAHRDRLSRFDKVKSGGTCRRPFINRVYLQLSPNGKIVKTRQVPLKLTEKQKIDRWIHTSRYVYNKTVNDGSKLDARNLFVTRKDSESINELEFETPTQNKGIRLL